MKNDGYQMPVDATTLHLPFRDGYKDARFSNYAEFADECGVSQSTVNKFLSGALKNPNVFCLASMASVINARVGYTLLSLDELMGIEHHGGLRCADHASLIEELKELREANAEKDQLISELSREADVAGEKLRLQRRALKERRPLVTGLFTVIILLIFLLTYVIADASSPQWGFFHY